MIRRKVARLVLRSARWQVVGSPAPRGVLVGAPHTSNWDFVLTLLVMWSLDCRPQVLVKEELFRGPLGWVLTRLGGIPVDRSRPTGVVRMLIHRARSGEPFQVVLAAEGTRQPVTYWKSGFYRIAQLTGLPISLGFIDGPTRTAGFGPSLTPTGDMVADMDVIRRFYADKHGLRPALRTEPRLREETAGEPAQGETTGD